MEKVVAEIWLAAEGKKSGQMFTDFRGGKGVRTARHAIAISDTSREMARTSESINQFFLQGSRKKGFYKAYAGKTLLTTSSRRYCCFTMQPGTSSPQQINEFSVVLQARVSR